MHGLSGVCIKKEREIQMIKLPNNRENWNWHQWLTFRCNFSCEYCIMGERQLGGGTPKWKPKELSGKEIVDFWNNVEK